MNYNNLEELKANISRDTLIENPTLGSVNGILLPDSHMATDANTPKPSKYHNQRTHPEKDLEQFVHNTAKACGLLYYHTYRSRYSEPGFPDCIILGKWLLVVELKNTGKMPTPAQNLWLNVFRALKVDTRLWRPEDKDEIVETLARMRVI